MRTRTRILSGGALTALLLIAAVLGVPWATPSSAAPLNVNVAFEHIPGKSALDIAVSNNGTVWIAGTDGKIYRLNGTTWEDGGYPQEHEMGTPQRIAATPDGVPWIVTSNAWMPNIPAPFTIRGRGGDAKAQDVSIAADGIVWFITTDNAVMRFNDPLIRDFPVEGGARRIAVAPNGTVWVTRPDNRIFAWETDNWVEKGGLAKDVAVGANGDVWIVGVDDAIWKRVGDNWDRANGPAAQIAVAPNGAPLIVDANGNVFRATSVGGENRPPVAAPPTPVPPPVQRVDRGRASINILCDFTDAPASPDWRKDSIQDMFMGQRGLDQYIQEMSYGQASLAGTRTVGRYTLPRGAGDYYGGAPTQTEHMNARQRLTDDCIGAAGADLGTLPDTNATLISMFFNAPIGVGGSVAVQTVNVNGAAQPYTVVQYGNVGWNSPGLVAHEMGHVFGQNDIESEWDPMGGAWLGQSQGATLENPRRERIIGYSTYVRDLAGWIPADRKVTYTGQGEQRVTLTRLTQPLPQAMLMARTERLADGTFYTVEYRTPTGFDAALPLPGGVGAVIIHRSTTHIPGARVPMMAVREKPTDAPDSDGVRWIPGETYNDPANNISIRVDVADATGAVVTFGPAR